MIGKKLSVELEITLHEDTYFPVQVRDTVNGFAWSADDSPKDSDYLLELIVWLLHSYRDLGIHLDSATVGVKQTYAKQIVVRDTTRQLTETEW